MCVVLSCCVCVMCGACAYGVRLMYLCVVLVMYCVVVHGLCVLCVWVGVSFNLRVCVNGIWFDVVWCIVLCVFFLVCLGAVLV